MGNESQIIGADPFFAPSNLDAVDVLLDEYARELRSIETVADFMSGDDMLGAMRYFCRGNWELFERITPDPERLFQRDAAVAAMDAAYWQRALNLTDVLDYMPDARRKEWHEQIHELKAPAFEEQTVRATLETLLSQRIDFLAEMIDGIFTGLSGEHVTNRPEGFGKRMIIDGVSNFYASGRKEGLIHDMRCVIAKFMGRDAPYYSATGQALEHFRRSWGEWHTMDGGALRIRVYKKGTAHLEVHPEIAWRLNQILAHLHPAAIPASFRQKPKRRAKRDFVLMERPIPFAVLEYLSGCRYWSRGNDHHQKNTLSPEYGRHREADKHVKQEAARIIAAIGGVWVPLKKGEHLEHWAFDYNAEPVIGEVLASGVIPDHKSHQYYPTPERLAAEVVEMAGVGPFDKVLEPSAGQGAIADQVPPCELMCVEASHLHCRVLEAKGYSVEQADFLEWASSTSDTYDRIVMNPPFSQGRARAHLEAAVSVLEQGGRLVAVLPAGLRGKDLLPGLSLSWSEVLENEFAGTSVDVVILTVEKG